MNTNEHNACLAHKQFNGSVCGSASETKFKFKHFVSIENITGFLN